MEVEESVVVPRKRTESNGGSSDSDLSEGWNIVDHLDANSPEAPSSDGESVEVIEAEEENLYQDADSEREEEGDVPPTETTELVSQSTALMSVAELPSGEVPPSREEMFDSSFCWFLVTATLALLVSHLAFLAAENVLEWNTSINNNSPSFLKDLPVTPKPMSQGSFAEKISWASDEDVIVDSVDEIFTKESDKTIIDKSSRAAGDKLQGTRNTLSGERQTLKIDHLELGKYIKVLSDVSSSVEAQKKFAQALLILDALHIGIDDLEAVVPASSELNTLVEKQKNKLNRVLTEVQFGMSRSMERLANNVLNKVETLERRFENQWCKHEKNGHEEELRGLFYDCDELGGKKKEGSDTICLEEPKSKTDNEKQGQMKVDSYKYEVDKDSTGKVHGKEHYGNGESSDYHNLVNVEKNRKRKHKHKDFANYDKTARKFTKKESRKEHYKNSEEETSGKRFAKKKKQSTEPKDRYNKEPVMKKSAEEIILRFFKERCKKILENRNSSTNLKHYHKLKEEVDKKLKISKELFDHLYLKFCVRNSEGAKGDGKHNKEYLKRDYKENTYTKSNIFGSNQNIIKDQVEKKIQFNIFESSHANNQKVDESVHSKNRVIEPTSQQTWTISYEIPPSTNKTNVDGYWFFKVGVSRSNVRWYHQRSDWWFDRASQRRHNRYNYPHPPGWYAGRHKNWFFRRAWARQQCKESPHNSWCHFDDETITVPNANFS